MKNKWLSLLLTALLLFSMALSVTPATATDTDALNSVETTTDAHVLNVTDFGAQPNTNTDQTAPIARAISSAAYGDTVYIPNGTYNITTLYVPDGVTISGQSRENTILKMTVEGSAAFFLKNRVDIRLENFSVYAENIGAHAVRAQNCDYLTLHNLRVYKIAFNGEGFKFISVNNSVISNCVMEEMGVCFEMPGPEAGDDPIWGAGIRIEGDSNNNLIVGNTINKTGRGGILVYGTKDLHIYDNTILNSGYTVGQGLGVEIWGGVGTPEENLRTIVQDNYIDHWYSGGGRYHAVRGNTIGDGSNDVIKGYGLETWHVDSVISDNYEDGGHGYGISDLGGHRTLYARNTIRNNVQWGVQFMGAHDGSENYQKYFYKTDFLDNIKGHPSAFYPGDDGHGVRLHSGSYYFTFNQCDVSGNGGTGFQLGSTENNGNNYLSIENCTVKNNRDAFTFGEYGAIEIINTEVADNQYNNVPTNKPFNNAIPTASMTFPQTAVAGQPVTFTSTSTDSDGTVAEFLWDFGDGIPSTDSTAVHTYEEPGTYPVTLVVWDNGKRGAVCEGQITITANAQQLADADSSELERQIDLANFLLDRNTVGTELGQYSQNNANQLSAAITQASTYLTSTSQQMIDAATEALQEDCALFEAQRNRLEQTMLQVPREKIQVATGTALDVNDGFINDNEWCDPEGGSVVLYLEQPTDVNGLIYYSNKLNSVKTGAYKIEVSQNGVNYTEVKSGTFHEKVRDEVDQFEIDFNAEAIQYIRFTAVSAMYGSQCGASELIVKGDIQPADYDLSLVCKEKFSYAEGSLLSATSTDASHGFSSGWTAPDGTSLGSNFTVSNGAANVVTSLYPNFGYEQPTMVRDLVNSIDFDSNNTYYLSFKMAQQDNYGGFSSFLSLGNQLSVGLEVGQTGTPLGGKLMFSGKLGSQSWNDGATIGLSYSTILPIVAKIVTRETGNDALYLNIYTNPAEVTLFPETWMAQLEAEITGEAEFIQYATTLIQDGRKGTVDDILLYQENEIITEGASSATVDGEPATTLQSGDVQLEKTLQSQHLDSLQIQPITVLYKDGNVQNLAVSEQLNYTGEGDTRTYQSEEFAVNLQDNASYAMKFFLWVKGALSPLCKPVVLDQLGLQ